MRLAAIAAICGCAILAAALGYVRLMDDPISPNGVMWAAEHVG